MITIAQFQPFPKTARIYTVFKYKLLLMSYDWEERAFPSIVNKYFDDKNDMHLDQLDQEFGDRE